MGPAHASSPVRSGERLQREISVLPRAPCEVVRRRPIGARRPTARTCPLRRIVVGRRWPIVFPPAPQPRTVQRGHWTVAVAVGIALASVVAILPFAWPTLAIGIGAIAAALAHVLGTARRTRYGLLGTAYCLGLAGVASWGVAPALTGMAWRALATGGAVGLLLVGAGALLRRAIGGLPAALAPDDLRSVPGSVLQGARLVGTLRTAVAVGGTIARLGGIVLVGVAATLLVGVAALLLDALAVSAPLPWFGGTTVDAVHLAFVVAVLAGFWVLAGVHLLAAAVATGVEAGRAARDRMQAAREASGDDAD